MNKASHSFSNSAIYCMYWQEKVSYKLSKQLFFKHTKYFPVNNNKPFEWYYAEVCTHNTLEQESKCEEVIKHGCFRQWFRKKCIYFWRII